MNNQDYLKWAITKDRTQAQYDELGQRLNNSTDQLRVLHGAMGISGEAGELMDAVKKHILYNKPLDVVNVKEELGDLCWYMSLLLDQIGSTWDEVMKMNHDKLEKRFPGGFTEKLAQQRLDKLDEVKTKAELSRVVEIEATRANLHGDPLESITYTLARVREAFPGQIFEFKKRYEFEYENGKKIFFNRNTDRFYSGKLGPGYEDMQFVPKGVISAGVFHRIVAIRLVE